LGNEDALALDHRCANVGITVRTHRARFDRPFLLEIRERQSGTVEFTGKIVRMP
jgi:serine protease inhibitor